MNKLREILTDLIKQKTSVSKAYDEIIDIFDEINRETEIKVEELLYQIQRKQIKTDRDSPSVS